jgi:type II secretory pathway predicted ATPase ExeA
LALMPFRISPDPKFLWLGSKHKKAYALLRHGIRKSKSLVVITGEPGTGKSAILNAIIAEFGGDVRFAKIIDPALSEMDFFNFIANAFEMGRTFRSKAEFLAKFESHIKAAGSKKMVLVIDEAQRLSVEMLEQIRVLANTEEPGRKVLSCIFAGQPEFLDILSKNRALRQRIFFSHMIQPLAQPETHEYIAHRLKVAGRQAPIFTPAAIEEIFNLSGGIPRLINIACDQALLIGYAMNKKKIGPDLVREGAHNTLIPLSAPKKPGAPEMQIAPAGIQRNPLPKMQGIKPAGRPAAYYCAGAILFAVGLSVFYFLNGGVRAPHTPPTKQTAQAVNRAQLAGPAPGVDDARRSQDQILELRRRKDEADANLKALQARIGSLESEVKGLQAAKDRAAGQERAIAWKDAAISELRKKLESTGSNQSAALRNELESVKKENSRLQDRLSAITKEKAVKDQISAELSSRRAEVVALQQKLDTAESVRLKLEVQIREVRNDNARLQAQLQALKTQRASSTAPAATHAQTTAPPAPAAVPDPASVIDYVIKKKSR